MLRRFIIFILSLSTLVGCGKLNTDVVPVSDLSPGIELSAYQGLIDEPVFEGQVFINLQGNPSGPIIILIHGLGDRASKIWDQTIDRLKQSYFLATLDLPGFGQSSKANELYSPENYVKLIQFIHQTYIGRPFHLVGHSLGGAISLRYAATYPNQIETLTLVNAAGILHRLAYTQYLAPLGLKPFAKYFTFDQKDVSSVAGFVLGKIEKFVRFDMNALLADATFRTKFLQEKPSVISSMALVFDDFSEMPDQITAPTQIIWGDLDEVAPPRTGHVLNALIPNSNLDVITQAGHIPISKNPDEFHNLLMQGITQRSNTRNKPDTAPLQNEAICNRQNDVRYQGHFTKLNISHCKNVIIKNATIDQLFIHDSRVFLQNVRVRSPRTALIAKRSTIEITAGEIAGNIAIEAHDSRLDIAGTELSGTEALITAPLPSSVVFSLARSLYQNKKIHMLHGQMNITPDKPLY